MSAERWRGLAAAASLANFLLMQTAEDLRYVQQMAYYLAEPPGRKGWILAASAFLLLTAALWAVSLLAGFRSKAAKIAAAGVFSLCTAVAVARLCTLVAQQNAGLAKLGAGPAWVVTAAVGTVGVGWLAVLGLMVAAPAVVVVCRRPDRIYGALSRALAMLVPVLLVNLGFLLFSLEGRAAAGARSAAASAARPHTAVRLVWVIFDEMDQGLTYGARPAGLRLPNLDALAGSALVATRAWSDGSWTREAIPSLLTGRAVQKAAPDGPNELRLEFQGGSAAEPWSRSPNLFTKAAKLGLRSGVVGWYHAYCRLFGSQLSACTSYAPVDGNLGILRYHELQRMSFGAGLWELARREMPGYRRDSPLTPGEVEMIRTDRVERLPGLLAAALRTAADPRLDLVLLHLPVPHVPGIWDRRLRRLRPDPHLHYLDNYELADDFVGRLRGQLEGAGLWERTALFITSDHSLRPFWREAGLNDPAVLRLLRESQFHYVPFLVRLPGTQGGCRYEREIPLLTAHDVALNLLQGAFPTHDSLARWLGERRGYRETRITQRFQTTSAAYQ